MNLLNNISLCLTELLEFVNSIFWQVFPLVFSVKKQVELGKSYMHT